MSKEAPSRGKALAGMAAFACLLLAATAWQGGESAMALKIQSPSFEEGGEIPSRFTCEGEDISPALTWEGLPEGARSLSLIVDDPDAPDPAHPRMTWVHWVLYNIPAQASGLEEGSRNLPSGTREGLNDWKRTGYRGPCPPIGRHRYFFKLYALDTELANLDRPAKSDLEKAMQGHILAHAQIVGTYRKKR